MSAADDTTVTAGDSESDGSGDDTVGSGAGETATGHRRAGPPARTGNVTRDVLTTRYREGRGWLSAAAR